MPNEPRYWYRARRYGWGWGAPIAWQGWLVCAILGGLLAAGPFLFPPRAAHAKYVGYIFLIAAAQIAICWLKGEPPRWRWSGDKRS